MYLSHIDVSLPLSPCPPLKNVLTKSILTPRHVRHYVNKNCRDPAIIVFNLGGRGVNWAINKFIT